MALVNLEPLCARYGMHLVDQEKLSGYASKLPDREHTIAELKAIKLTDKENIITKALGVLVENGIYAMTVFLMTCNKPLYGGFLLCELAALLADKDAALLADKDAALLPDKKWENKDGLLELLKAMRSLTEDLPRLLLARRMLEGALTFARYHCKALKRLDGVAS